LSGFENIDWKMFLRSYVPARGRRDEQAAIAVCRLALRAAANGTYGVGAVLLDENREVIVEGHNQVYGRRFRSDLHAEMVVMNKFESRRATDASPRGCTLVTSLEPCPMCMTRLIFAGVGTILHVRSDDIGGMVQRKKAMPPVFREITDKQRQIWRLADCSPVLREAAFHIWDQSRLDLDRRIVDRGNRARPSKRLD
jgi:cytosine deaminase